MENADVFGSSTAPLTWHDFLERMRQPSAADFVKAIKSFIVSFSNNAPDPERDSKAVQEFLGNMEAAFRAHSLWAGCSEDELESAGEGLEKYVMTKLFSHVFASHPEDVKVDDQLYEKIALIQQFVRPENLDIKPVFQNEASWLGKNCWLLGKAPVFIREQEARNEISYNGSQVLKGWTGLQWTKLLMSNVLGAPRKGEIEC